MIEDEEYSHPIPGHVANRAARYYSVPVRDFHELLEDIDNTEGLRNDLQARSKQSENFEILKRGRDATYYRVTREWVYSCYRGRDVHFNATNALSQCYDRTVVEETNAHIENGEGFVLSNK
ncbi:hypothetical protein [Natrinema pallidum]|uniref:Uncharacterized protein n=1 Tax=Natrinema pallidum TaxID=69527 RepID=A0A4P9TKB8_9EURY|nr:hypothetical protein [Natrinema pallidum]QCW05267.1 hypothetical protein FGF80_18665 [Natrinema pallidum]